MSDDSRARSRWRAVGITLAVIVGVAGLVFVALIIIFMSAMANYGSNK